MWRRPSVALLLVAAGFTFIGAAPARLSWPTFQGNTSHTGYVPVSLDPKHFSFRWERAFQAGLGLNPVAAADGKVFASESGYFSPSTNLYALDAGTGRILWTVDFGDVFSVNPPSYADGKIYIQTGNHGSDTYLRAYDADSGDLLFRSAHAAQWERYYAPTVDQGVVYVNGGYYGGMYAFDSATGARRWFTELPQYDQWTPAVDGQRAYAYVGPWLHALDRLSGAVIFTILDPNFNWLGWSMRLAPVLGTHDNAFVIQYGRLVSFDLASRSVRWEIAGEFIGQVSLANGVLYAIDAGALTARDELSGELLWAWEAATGNLMGSLFVTRTHVFVQTDERVYALDLVRHDAVWSYPASGSLAYSEGMLYIASYPARLTAIRLRPGRGVSD